MKTITMKTITMKTITMKTITTTEIVIKTIITTIVIRIKANDIFEMFFLENLKSLTKIKNMEKIKK